MSKSEPLISEKSNVVLPLYTFFYDVAWQHHMFTHPEFTIKISALFKIIKKTTSLNI